MKKEMLINVLQPEECRIAIVEDGVLEELYVERTSHESYVGNIYKGRIVNIEPSIQAAFVDFGIGRNGFLHVSDVEPAYYRHLEERRENGGRRGDRGERGGRDRGRGAPPLLEEEPSDEDLPEVEPIDAVQPAELEPTEEREPRRGRGPSKGRPRSGGRGRRRPREAEPAQAGPEETAEAAPHEDVAPPAEDRTSSTDSA